MEATVRGMPELRADMCAGGSLTDVCACICVRVRVCVCVCVCVQEGAWLICLTDVRGCLCAGRSGERGKA